MEITLKGAGQFFDFDKGQMQSTLTLTNPSTGDEVSVIIEKADLDKVMGLYNKGGGAPRRGAGPAQADLHQAERRASALETTPADLPAPQPLATPHMVETRELSYEDGSYHDEGPAMTDEEQMLIEAAAVPGEL